MGAENVLTYGAAIVTGADSGLAIAGDRTPINVLSNTGQMIAAYFSPFPGASIAVAPGAAIMTFGKIYTDSSSGVTISPGDILSIAGNVVAVVGAVGVLTAAAPAAAAIGLSAASIGLVLGAMGALSNTPFGTQTIEAWRQGILDALDGSAPLAPIPLTDPPFDPAFYRVPGLSSVIDPICNRDFTAARNWTAPRDPLVLDLDGDGIETVGINALAPILFDHDADGIKTGTGWVASERRPAGAGPQRQRHHRQRARAVWPQHLVAHRRQHPAYVRRQRLPSPVVPRQQPRRPGQQSGCQLCPVTRLARPEPRRHQPGGRVAYAAKLGDCWCGGGGGL
jgi:hypothetical protein